MNYFKQNVFFLGLMAMLSCSLLLVSCGNDDDATDDGGSNGEVILDDLSALIADAESLLDGATEGTLGGYFYGAIAKLQSAIDDAQGLVDDGETDADLIDLGFDLLEEAIAAFNESIITFEGNPWVQQVAGNTIILTDNIEGGGIEGGLLSLIEDTRDFTIELEFNPVSLNLLGDDAPMLSTAKQLNEVQGEPDVDDGFYLRHFADGNIRYTTGQPGQNGDENWSWQRIQEADAEASLTGFAAGKWNHIALVHEGENRRVYVNGILAQEGTSGYADISDREDVLGIYLGGTPDWTNRVANGLFKNVRIWSTVLSDTELNQDVAAVGDGLEAWFPMEYENAAEFADVSGFYKAVLTDLVVWAPNGDVTEVEVDYSELEALVSDAETFVASIDGTEGIEVGNFGIGTAEYLGLYINDAQSIIDEEGSGADVAGALESLQTAFDFAEANTVTESGTTDGIIMVPSDEQTVGFRITRTDLDYIPLPEGSYTVEVEVLLNDFVHPFGTQTNILGTGALQFRTSVSQEGADVNVNEGKIEFYVEGDSWDCACDTVAVMKTEEWVKLAAVYDEVEDTTILYMNGEAIASGPGLPYTRRENNGWTDMWLGNRSGAGNILDGMTKELRVWNVVRDVADLNADIVGDETGLEMYFPLDTKNAPLYKDVTGNYFGEPRNIDWND